MCDLAAEPELPRYIMERITEVHAANLRAALRAAGDVLDIVYFYDDFASQTGLLIRPEMYDLYVRPFHQQLIDIAAQFGKPVMLHSCGAVFPLIPRLIDMGISILNPIQPRARGMAAENLRPRFRRPAGISRRHRHPGTAAPRHAPQVKAEAARVAHLLGGNGGYMLAGAHHIQADTPVENVLAMYEDDLWPKLPLSAVISWRW